MKTLLVSIAAAVFLAYTSFSFAAYVIHLKDGTKFVTDQCYEEGDQIKFKRYGGLIGIEKERVSVIEKVENLPEKTPVRVEPGRPTADGKPEAKDELEQGAEGGKKLGAEGEAKEKEQPVEASEEAMKKAEWEKIAKMQKLLEEKRQIMREKEAVITSYKEAKARKNMEKKKQYWNELLSLQKKLGNLRERAVAENGGGLPDWWDAR